ncbi:hypothetical protein EXIGLDRAFT_269025 [Exidia glandulosa HHB12029]|uniref:Uncharacterized protein n=1 Tax=Exidia glandulosa HHB12029 TaxID=1314781 RepID=A0A165DNF7_EXIGL|nr:hypothetical protein EXIGLDRAFT_269025 [Exidia glandulosa HHB12029]
MQRYFSLGPHVQNKYALDFVWCAVQRQVSNARRARDFARRHYQIKISVRYGIRALGLASRDASDAVTIAVSPNRDGVNIKRPPSAARAIRLFGAVDISPERHAHDQVARSRPTSRQVPTTPRACQTTSPSHEATSNTPWRAVFASRASPY